MKAFPAIHDKHCQEGMDLRDYFAAHAMQAYYNAVTTSYISGLVTKDSGNSKNIAKAAYAIADAMMKVREK